MEKIDKPSKRYIVDETGAKHKFFDYDEIEIIGDNLIHVKKSGIHFLTDIYNNKIDSFAYSGDEKTETLDSLGNEEKCYKSSFDVLKEIMKKEKDDSLNTCKPSDLKFKYILKIHKFDDKDVIKEFDSKDKCDKYYDELMKKIEEYNMNVQDEINKVYKDANDSLDEFLGSSKVKK